METARINLLDKNGDVQYGLNWAFEPDSDNLRIEKGNSVTARTGDEGYFQLSPEVWHSDFFPVNKNYFYAESDDGSEFIFERVAKNDKGTQLSTPENNQLIGKWIRKRLGVRDCSKIKKIDIENYGRSDIVFTKISQKHFKMDFSKQTIDTSQLFHDFLKSEEKSETTIRQYISDLRKYSDGCVKEKAIAKGIFSIINSLEFETVKTQIQNSNFFLDTSGNKLQQNPNSGLNIKAALNQYSDFLKSDFFKNNYQQIHVTVFPPSQIIYYGVPGSGKSYKIDDQLKTHFGFTKEQIETNTMRVVFHPEYTNADFVGQVMPVISDSNTDTKVTYKFTPGPFAKILRKAYQHPDENYCLIIEEINRGNAAAIFGDIFQLLDRLGADESDDNFTQGWSKYFISNDYLNWYIRENVYDENDKDRDLGKAEKGEDVANKAIKIEGRKFTENTGIRLPPNLSLLATMNTSDQNVFTLDNAFQRRWDMQLVENIFGTSDEEQNQQNAIIVSKDGNVTWKNFQQEINSLISEKSNEVNLSSMEDKRIGCWFVKAENGEINIIQFKNKVLKYLWDDAFKFCRLDVFEKGIDSFEKLQESFAEKGFTVIPALQGKLTFSKETPLPNADTGNAGNTGTAAEDTPQTEV